MKTLNIGKGYHLVRLSEDAPIWRINLSDYEVEATYNKVKGAVEKAKSLTDKELEAEGDELEKAINETVKFQRRTISAIVGKEAYNDLLLYLSPDDKPVDPVMYKIKIGDVMAALLVEFVTVAMPSALGELSDLMKKPRKKKRRK